jgi:heme exporter protein A
VTESILLEAQECSVNRGLRTLVSGVSLKVAAGSMWHLVGSNGVGKTSLLRALAGLARIQVTGDIKRHAPMLYFGHSLALKSALTPRDNLNRHPSGGPTSDSQAIDKALSAVRLEGYEDAVTGRLSAGQQRRVALARLWLSPPPLWLLDEPFTALDTSGITVLENKIVSHCSAGGAVVFTSHQAPDLGAQLQTINLEDYRGD